MFVREEKEKFRSQEREKRKERREKREEPPLFFWFELGVLFLVLFVHFILHFILFCVLFLFSHPFLFVKKDVCFRARRESEKKDSTTKNVVPSKRAFVIYCSLYIDYLDKERQGYNTKRN